jgi:hypothetical protein
MALPGTLKLTYYMGDSLDFEVVWKDEAGVVKDITGWSARLHVRDAEGLQVLELTSPSTGLVVTGAAGKTTVQATPTLMRSGKLVGNQNYQWGMDVTSPDASMRQTLLVGPFITQGDVTND